MFLIDKFQEFHLELVRLKARVTSGGMTLQGDESRSGDSAAKESPSAVWRRLSSLLDRQRADAGTQGGDFGRELYDRAQYAMAALADDYFLNLDWAGRDNWRNQSLEAKFFNSHRAGEALFERVEELLKDRDLLRLELARIYLMVLGLGFLGKYRDRPDAEERIAVYRHRIYHFIFNQDPVTLRGDVAVVPQAYSATLDEAVSTELPYLRPWIWATAGALLLWLGGTYAVWRVAVGALTPAMTSISKVEDQEKEEEAKAGPLAEADEDDDGDGVKPKDAPKTEEQD
jgi:type VI secretion system protein ImpK